MNMKLKMSSQRLIALIFIILMFGSTFAYAILNAFMAPEQTTQIPNQRIINYRLNEQQRSYLLQRGYTLIEYSYFTGCIECANIKNKLEQITLNSDDQIFLQELISTESVSTSLSIASLKDQKTLYDPTDEEIESIVCDILINRPLWCITAEI